MNDFATTPLIRTSAAVLVAAAVSSCSVFGESDTTTVEASETSSTVSTTTTTEGSTSTSSSISELSPSPEVVVVWDAVDLYLGGPDVGPTRPPPQYPGNQLAISLELAGDDACAIDPNNDRFVWDVTPPDVVSQEGDGCSILLEVPQNLDDEYVIEVVGGHQDYGRSQDALALTVRPSQSHARLFVVDVSSRMAESTTAGLTRLEFARDAVDFQHTNRTPEYMITALWTFGGGVRDLECQERVDNPMELAGWRENQLKVTSELDALNASDIEEAPLITSLVRALGSLPSGMTADDGHATFIVLAGGGNICPGVSFFDDVSVFDELERAGVVVDLFLVGAAVLEDNETWTGLLREVGDVANEFPDVLRAYVCLVDDERTLSEPIDLSLVCGAA